jgi:DNA-binding MarR family transcriptional regulator
MKGKNDFIDYVEKVLKEDEISEEGLKFWNYFKENKEQEKPLFTENGKKILIFLQENQDTEIWDARRIGAESGMSSRSVSGSIRKLVSDGYVEKVGANPIIYTLTEQGKNYIFED